MQAPPALSIVVPTRERRERLRSCLAAISRLEAPEGGVEVVVADDGGCVGRDDAAAAGDVPVRVVAAGGRGPAAARNAGAAAARARIIAFTDDDCEPQPAWARALTAAAARSPGALLGGRTRNGLPGNACSRTAQAIADAAVAHHGSGPDGPRFFPSNNLAVPADRFAELGGFDERIGRAGGEDRDLCERWAERGWALESVPEARVTHFHDLSLRGFWRQQRTYGAGAFHHRAERRRRGGGRRLEPSLTSGVLARAARSAVADRDPARLALLGVWQAANFRGFAGAALRSRAGR